jgi:uncharacterized protein (TIGR02246 family)
MDKGAADLHRQFEDAFNARDLEGLVALYEDDAAFIPQPGTVVRGKEQIRAALQSFLDVGGTMRLVTKDVVEVGELAYLINRWSLTGTDPNGEAINMGAVTAEVARRQSDGSWLYVIDNAWGDQHADT